MMDGLVRCETRASLAHRLAGTSLFLLLSVLPTGHATGCARPPLVPHGRGNLTETNRGSLSVGTLLRYSCDPGFTLDGSSIITCTVSGRWSSEPPHCIQTTSDHSVCQPPSEPENGGYNCHPSPCLSLTHGTVVEFFCDEGFMLKGGYQFRTCENGEWRSPVQISCHPVQGEDPRAALPVSALSIVASTASSVALVLLLVLLFVLLQPKLKSFHHSRRDQGVLGQPASITVEGVPVSLPSYEEAVSGAEGCSASRGQIVPSEELQADSSSERGVSAASSCHAEAVLVQQVPTSAFVSSYFWAVEQPVAAAAVMRRQSSDEHSLLSVTSAEDFSDDIPLLKDV